MDVSVELIATILAILRSGSAYVVLDPSGSAERNNRIVEDTEADFVVVDEKYSSFFTRSVVLRAALSKGLKATGIRGQIEVKPDDPAYLIYTSGMSLK